MNHRSASKKSPLDGVFCALVLGTAIGTTLALI